MWLFWSDRSPALSRFCLQNKRNFTRSILPPLTFGGQYLFFSTPFSQIYAHPDLRGFLWADVFVWEGGRSRKKHTLLPEIRTPKIVSMVTCKFNKFTLDFNFGKIRIIFFVLFRHWISRPHKIHSQDFFYSLHFTSLKIMKHGVIFGWRHYCQRLQMQNSSKKLTVAWLEAAWAFIYTFWYTSTLYEGEKPDHTCKFIESKSTS